MGILKAIGNWIWPVGAAALLLLFTPIGSIVNGIVSGCLVLASGYLFLSAILELFSFKDWGDAEHWTGIVKKLAGGAALLVVVAVLMTILPSPPLGSRNDFCVETRSNPC